MTGSNPPGNPAHCVFGLGWFFRFPLCAPSAGCSPANGRGVRVAGPHSPSAAKQGAQLARPLRPNRLLCQWLFQARAGGAPLLCVSQHRGRWAFVVGRASPEAVLVRGTACGHPQPHCWQWQPRVGAPAARGMPRAGWLSGSPGERVPLGQG